ncbi:MAG: 2-amino-4-hydroxy-6-hydroxymethyldihydropteridine diphosphokinase [Elainellaceae cyanobacterium]
MARLRSDSAAADSSHSPFRHRAAIALGSNLGNSEAILAGALDKLSHMPDVEVSTVSPIFVTAAVGPPQPDYLNACALLTTHRSPRELLTLLLDIETQFGRERRERWGPRRLDLDLLMFDDCIIEEPGLQIPHPRMAERAFVLVPLAEVAPDWVEPTTGEAIAHLLTKVDQSGVTLKTASFSAL